MRYSDSDHQLYYKNTKQLLDKEVAKESILDLRDTLVYHEWRYYVLNQPIISDFEYDKLFDSLKNIESKFPQLIVPNSPTQRVSSDIQSSFETVKHIAPMLSLANSYNAEDLTDFDTRIKKLTQQESIIYAVEPKFDGGSIAIIYENDLLTRGATRGNGNAGDEITENLRAIPSIPLQASFSKYGIAKVEIRGEALIRKDRFKEVNKKREKNGLPLFANPRNAATGGLRTKDTSDTQSRGLTAFIFQLAYAEDSNGTDITDSFASHYENMMMLAALGFKIPEKEIGKFDDISQVIAFCSHWQDIRENYDYEIDGMVVKVDNVDQQNMCGYTQHHPKWAIAYKFKAKQSTTTLLDIEYQVGKIGSITPVAKLDPVQLAGVTVSSVSLHNAEFISSKDLRIGDQVLVERAGDVIPYIVKSFPELRSGVEVPVKFPSVCPINHSDFPVTLIQEEGEAAWRCPNCVCGKQTIQRLIFHVSKVAMNIDGLGKSQVEKFYDMGWIKDMADIYNLDYEAILSLDGFKERSVDNLKNAIDKAKTNPLHRVLHSLSIHHLGKKASKVIAENIEQIFDLQTISIEQLNEIKDIGPVVAENIIAYFAEEQNVEMLRRMESYGVNVMQLEEDRPLVVADDAPFSGKTILFTGSLSQVTRKQAQELAAKAGAKNISAVSGNLNILVVGEKAGSKLKKAQALGTVEIMSEAEFIERVN